MTRRKPGLVPLFGGAIIRGPIWEIPAVLICGALLLAAFSLWVIVSNGLLFFAGSVPFICALAAFVWIQHTDPGSLPSSVLRIETPSCSYRAVLAPEMRHALWQSQALTTRVVVEGSPGIARFCKTCFIWRPPHAHHCRRCDFCISSFDHHCGVLGRCIGERNHAAFLWLLWSSATACVLSLGTALGVTGMTILSSGEHLQPRESWVEADGQTELWTVGGSLFGAGLFIACCASRFSLICGGMGGPIGTTAVVIGGILLLKAYAAAGASQGRAVPAIILAALTGSTAVPLFAFACSQSISVARRISTKARLLGSTAAANAGNIQNGAASFAQSPVLTPGDGLPLMTPATGGIVNAENGAGRVTLREGARRILSLMTSRPPPPHIDWAAMGRLSIDDALAAAVAQVDCGDASALGGVPPLVPGLSDGGQSPRPAASPNDAAAVAPAPLFHHVSDPSLRGVLYTALLGPHAVGSMDEETRRTTATAIERALAIVRVVSQQLPNPPRGVLVGEAAEALNPLPGRMHFVRTSSAEEP